MKTLLSSISNTVKLALFAVIFIGPMVSQAQSTPVTRLYTDFGGFFTSAGTSGYTLPNNNANLIGFTYNGLVYSTGVNNTALTNNSVPYENTVFQGFAVTSMTGNAGGASSFLAFGKAVDGDANNPVFTNVNIAGKTTLNVLSDGIQGLNLHTGVTNINAGSAASFPVACINTASIGDAVPDILLSQIADMSNSDTYAFYNASGQIVGNSINVGFSNPANPIGRWALDLFTLQTAPYNTATAASNGSTGANGFRDIKLAAYRLSDFGITSANASQVVSFRVTAGGGSDPAFYAYNAGSLSVTAANAGTVSSNQIICSGNTTSVSVSGTTGSIQWQQSPDGSTGWANVTGGSGATSATYNTPMLSTTTYYRAVVTVSPCSSATSGTVTVTVNPTSSAGTTSADPTICPNTNTVLTLTGAVGTIQWQQSNDGSTGWANVTGGSGATTASYTTPNLNVTTYYRAIVTSGVCTPATSSTATVTVSSTNTWTGVTSTDWNTPSNWSCNIVPDATIDANVPVVGTGLYPALTNATGTCRNLNISSGASLIVTGTGFIRIAGTINSTGTINVVDGGVNFIGSSAQQIPTNVFQTNFVKNLTITNTAGVTNNGALSITGTLNPVSGTFTTGDAITLKSNAGTTAQIAPVTGVVSGTMIIERYIPARRAFRFLTSPVDGGTIRANWQEGGANVVGLGTDITGTSPITNGFDSSLSNNPSMFRYLNINPNPGNSNWAAVTNTNNTNLVAGTAYRILVRGDRTVDQTDNDAPATNTTIRSTGTIRQGDVVRTDINQTAGGFSMIGNPYQAPVNMETVLGNLTGTTNINRTFYYVWDPTINTRGGYVTVNVSNNTNTIQDPDGPYSSVADRFAQPGQAFFVMTDANGAGQLTFRESDKGNSTTTTQIFRTAADDAPVSSIRMTLFDAASLAAAAPAADGFVVTFDSSYSNEADSMDAKKPVNQDENAGMMIGDVAYSFQSHATPVAADIIQLTHTQYRHTQYVYRARVTELNGTTAYLKDTFLGTQTALANNDVTEVAFDVDPADANSSAANRFQIVFEELLGSADSEFSNNVSVFPNPVTGQQFFVKVPAGENFTVSLVNVLGQEFTTTNIVSGANTLQVTPDNSLSSGVYMVRITNGNVSATKKLIVK